MYYCGVCKSIGRRYGNLERFGLVNEMGMLALLLDCISNKAETTEFEIKNCIAHPLKKTPAVKNSLYTDYAADVNVVFAYFKLMDSWQDDKNFFAAVFAKLAFGRAVRKAKKNIPSVYDSIKNNLNKLSAFEKSQCKSIDETAHCFSELMADIFSEAPEIKEHIKSLSEVITEEKLVCLRNLGYYIGKWVYLIDALYDIEDDLKKGSYNPILLRFDYNHKETVSQFKDRIKEPLEFVFHDALGHCCEAWEVLCEDVPDTGKYKDGKAFMENVLYLGMRGKTMRGFLSNESI
ncbi:MAG: hypothetical protein E7388_03990 [Ruminococcaceae bacterium]|nr:hypothetical protein [Oscillospiraceae bacterium]